MLENGNIHDTIEDPFRNDAKEKCRRAVPGFRCGFRRDKHDRPCRRGTSRRFTGRGGGGRLAERIQPHLEVQLRGRPMRRCRGGRGEGLRQADLVRREFELVVNARVILPHAGFDELPLRAEIVVVVAAGFAVLFVGSFAVPHLARLRIQIQQRRRRGRERGPHGRYDITLRIDPILATDVPTPPVVQGWEQRIEIVTRVVHLLRGSPPPPDAKRVVTPPPAGIEGGDRD